jgi:uncharacterized peroxidase-related enzyme
VGSHAAVAAELLGGNRDLVEAALKNYRGPAVPERWRALLAFVERLNERPSEINEADVAAAKAAGWTDEALYDAITVCALFNFYNRWVDGSGVGDMPAAAYQISGRRMAAEGYVRDEGT